MTAQSTPKSRCWNDSSVRSRVYPEKNRARDTEAVFCRSESETGSRNGGTPPSGDVRLISCMAGFKLSVVEYRLRRFALCLYVRGGHSPASYSRDLVKVYCATFHESTIFPLTRSAISQALKRTLISDAVGGERHEAERVRNHHPRTLPCRRQDRLYHCRRPYLAAHGPHGR